MIPSSELWIRQSFSEHVFQVADLCTKVTTERPNVAREPTTVDVDELKRATTEVKELAGEIKTEVTDMLTKMTTEVQDLATKLTAEEVKVDSLKESIAEQLNVLRNQRECLGLTSLFGPSTKHFLFR